jgi:hypothetical protein
MNCAITKHLPCSVCGLVTFRHHNWFLLMENRWLDRLKILSWHSSLARQADIKSACSREHLKVLVAYWLEQASLRLASPAQHPAILFAEYPDSLEIDLDPPSGGRVIGELSVCREPRSRGWAGSPAELECILDALTPAETEGGRRPVEFRVVDPPRESSQSWAEHPWAADPWAAHPWAPQLPSTGSLSPQARPTHSVVRQPVTSQPSAAQSRSLSGHSPGLAPY